MLHGPHAWIVHGAAPQWSLEASLKFYPSPGFCWEWNITAWPSLPAPPPLQISAAQRPQISVVDATFQEKQEYGCVQSVDRNCLVFIDLPISTFSLQVQSPILRPESQAFRRHMSSWPYLPARRLLSEFSGQHKTIKRSLRVSDFIKDTKGV